MNRKMIRVKPKTYALVNEFRKVMIDGVKYTLTFDEAIQKMYKKSKGETRK